MHRSYPTSRASMDIPASKAVNPITVIANNNRLTYMYAENRLQPSRRALLLATHRPLPATHPPLRKQPPGSRGLYHPFPAAATPRRMCRPFRTASQPHVVSNLVRLLCRLPRPVWPARFRFLLRNCLADVGKASRLAWFASRTGLRSASTPAKAARLTTRRLAGYPVCSRGQLAK